MLNLLFARSNKLNTHPLAASKPVEKQNNLAQVSAGRQVTVTGFEQLSPQYRQHLEAYGLLPGRSLQVLAQRPLTIVLIEQTELAFESQIAQKILVK